MERAAYINPPTGSAPFLVTTLIHFNASDTMLFKNVLLLATLATSATALPGMGAGPDGEQLQKKRGCPFGFDKLSKKAAMPEAAAAAGSEHEAHEKRILGLGETVGNLVGGVGDLLDGLVGSLASLGNGEVRVPDADHPFQEPGPSDQRGPCPGLNALANHGCKLSSADLSWRSGLPDHDQQTSPDPVSSRLERSLRVSTKVSTWVLVCTLVLFLT